MTAVTWLVTAHGRTLRLSCLDQTDGDDDLLGTTLDTTIRLMSRWQKEGVIVTAKTGFTIPRLEVLRELAAGRG